MEEIISVSQYLNKLNITLKGEKAKIIGEVSEVKIGPSGHFYFSLKDEKDGAVISCIIWKFKYNLYGVELKDGIKIYATGAPNIYASSGRLSFICDVIEPAGEGALQMAYLKLKKKLENEGFFDESKKRALPNFPHRIGVISSKNGAVINDFLTNIGKFGYEILFVDSRVEGQDAIKDLLSAVEILRNKNVDVLVIMRGGGSLESFQAFNNETLIRSVAEFPAPVLTGIGHEKDMPLISLASDKNVSTPTAVANILNFSWNQAMANINLSEQKILSSFMTLLGVFEKAEQTLFNGVNRIESGIAKIKDAIAFQTKELNRGFVLLSTSAKDFLIQSEKFIISNSPQNQLSRGYSITKYKGKILRSVNDVKKGDELDISVSDGIIKSITQ